MGETDCSLVGYGTLTEKDWNVLYDLASNQGLTETVFSAIEKLPKSQMPPLDLLMDWLGQVEYIKSSNEGYREKAHDLLEVYRSKGIIFVVLKGESCARYYPDPEKRALGDLDVFLLEEPMEVSSFKFQVSGDKGVSGCYMGGHEWAYEEGNRLAEILGAKVDIHDYKHSHISYKGLIVENHRLLTTARGSKEKKSFEMYLQNLLEIRNSAQFEALFLTVHAYQHFMEDELSLRQLCDWAMFVKACCKEVDWNDYFQWMEQLNMLKFANAVRWITQYQFAIDGDYPPTAPGIEQLAERLLDDTLCGRHGQMSSENIVKYRIWQTKKIFHSSWKYRLFRNENVLVSYTKMLWNHWFDKV